MHFVISSINDNYPHQVRDEIREMNDIRNEANYELTLKVSNPRKSCDDVHFSVNL